MIQLYACQGTRSYDESGMAIRCMEEDYGQSAEVHLDGDDLVLTVQEPALVPRAKERIPLPCGAKVGFWPISPCKGFPCAGGRE